MSDVTSHNDGTLQVDTGAYWILAQLSTYSIDTLVEVNLDTLGTLTWVAELLWNQLCWVLVHLLQPDTVLVDLSLDVAVGRAAYTHTDRAACTVTRQTDDTDIVSQILTAELCTQANLVSLFEELVLQVDITEGTTSLITCCRQLIVVLDRSQLHGKEVLLGRSTTDNEGDVVRRTCSCTQALHLLYEEWEECALILDSSLGHRVEVGLVGRATTLGNHYEAILVALCSLDINLSRKVATGVHLIIHIERSVLRIAEVVLCVGVVNTQAQSLFVLEVGPYALTLLAVDDSSTCILAEWENALHGSLCIAEELESYILVVL